MKKLKEASTLTSLNPLNDLQKQAVTSSAKRLLVLAGAGSGKTKTLLQKITYLIDQQAVPSAAIMAITFTKNAANEMVDRLLVASDTTGQYKSILDDKSKTFQEKEQARLFFKRQFRWIDNLTISTFHSFCYKVLRNFGAKQFDNKFKIVGDRKEEEELGSIAAPETAFEVYHKLLIEMCSDNEYLLALKRYILDYVIDKIHIEHARMTLPKEGKYYTTLNGDKVRSKSEQFIADWLYRHSIPYEYEPLLNVRDFEFHPDFYIPGANLYIEHVSDRSYRMRDKEEQFKHGQLLLVKTYEGIAADSALFNHTLDSIVRGRLPEGYHKTVALSFNEEFNRYHDHVKDFIIQVMRVTDMLKVEGIDEDVVLSKSQTDQHERVRSFYNLAIPLCKKYKDYCINRSYLDFNDLISTTVDLFTHHPDILEKFREKYQYILVDEFQDVNNLQVKLISQLLTPQTQLFCVGDDWQSIYGFRGSNVSYIVEFEKHFPEASVIKLNLNYRSTQHIVGASNEVIRHNRYKVDKEVSASKMSEQKIVVFAGSKPEENVSFCINTVEQLLKEGYAASDILFLYRRTKMYHPYYTAFKHAGLKMQGRTIHGAKGLEAKAVFIVGLSEGSGGFPDIWMEDRIFQVIKKADHNMLMEEERRLFYVAITRAKEKLYLITEKGNESSFIREIPQNYTVRTSEAMNNLVEEVMLCRHCNSQLERLFAFCPYCGKKQ